MSILVHPVLMFWRFELFLFLTVDKYDKKELLQLAGLVAMAVKANNNSVGLCHPPGSSSSQTSQTQEANKTWENKASQGCRSLSRRCLHSYGGGN